jgi:hypothetical protein
MENVRWFPTVNSSMGTVREPECPIDTSLRAMCPVAYAQFPVQGYPLF